MVNHCVLKVRLSFKKLLSELPWIFFLIWSSVGMVITGLNINAQKIEEWRASGLPDLFCNMGMASLYIGSLVFMAVASIIIFQVLSKRHTLRRVTMAFILIAIVSGVVEAVGTLTGYPFGQYHYTDAMGPQLLGVLPLAIPLAWWIVVAGLLVIFQQIFPQMTRAGIYLCTAAGATSLDAVMEPYAWKVTGYWLWEGSHVPLQNYFGWFILSFLLAMTSQLGFVEQPASGSAPADRDWRPLIILGIMMTQFVLGKIGRAHV